MTKMEIIGLDFFPVLCYHCAFVFEAYGIPRRQESTSAHFSEEETNMETGKRAFKSVKEENEFIKVVVRSRGVMFTIYVRGRDCGVKSNEVYGRLTKNDRDRTFRVKGIYFRTVEDQLAAGYGAFCARHRVCVDPKVFEPKQKSVFCGAQEDAAQAAVG